MGRPLRIRLEHGTYHVWTKTIDEIFLDNYEDMELFKQVLSKAKKKYGVIVYDYVLMNNHVHLLINTPRGNIDKFMHYLNGVFARKYNKLHGRSGHFWKARYNSILVVTEEYIFNLARYIVNNPVNANMVSHPSEWEWSSYHNYANGVEDDIVTFNPLYLEISKDRKKRI